MQIKTVGRFAFNREWKDRDTGEISPPLWVAVQASIEAFMSGRDAAAVGAMVISDGGTLDMHVLDVPLKAGILTELRRRTDDFWRRVHEGDPYPIDWGRDLEAFLSLNREDDGSEIDLGEDPEVAQLVIDRRFLKSIEKAGDDAAKARREVDAQLIARMGNARFGRFGDVLITASTINKRGFTVEPSSYRQVRVREAK